MNECSICGKRFEGLGNNPSPFLGERCCDECDNTVVIPVRLFLSGARKGQMLVVNPNGNMIIVDVDGDEVPLEELADIIAEITITNETITVKLDLKALVYGADEKGNGNWILGIPEDRDAIAMGYRRGDLDMSSKKLVEAFRRKKQFARRMMLRQGCMLEMTNRWSRFASGRCSPRLGFTEHP